MYSSYGIALDRRNWWSFGNGIDRNVIISGVENSSSSCVDNLKNNFLLLGKGSTFGFNVSFCSQEKKFSIIFTGANTIFCFSLH